MGNSLKIAVIQTALFWEDKTKNLAHYRKLILENSSQNSDIVVLPEMFTTGFSLSSKQLAENMDGPTLSWMKEMSQTTKAVICGSVIIEENNQFYNRFLWVEPNGKVIHYDKKHLFSFAGEDKSFNAGNTKVVIDYKGWRICPLICYDLRFPVWSRNKEDYDLLIYVANWPAARTFAFKTLLSARAIENQSYVIACNIVGKDGNNIAYSGYSSILDFKGQKLVESTKDEVINLSIDKGALDDFRKEKPFLMDRD